MSRSCRPEPVYGPRVADALAYAAEAFRHRVRKGSGVPYLVHLLQVTATVGDHGGSEDALVAAVLHDLLEDVEGTSSEALEARFGARVAAMVVALSDATSRPKAPWQARKDAYLARLRTADAEMKLVATADKLHNARSLLRDHARLGPAVFDQFSAPAERTLWFYGAVVDALAEGFEHAVLDELREVVESLRRLPTR